MSPTPSPGLYIVATPIGNLADLSPRARDILATVDLIACEDTRVTGKLLHLCGIKQRMVRHDDHAGEADRAALVARLGTEAIALVCDAGTPLISDPGYQLVRDARAAGHAVTTIPGPCAATAALTLAGLPSDRFLFVGFLPAKVGARAKALAELAGIRASLIFYESGPRLSASLAAMAAALGDRSACVVRELTKLHEETQAGTLSALAARFANAPKGEIVVVVGPPAPTAPEPVDAESLRAALRAAMRDAPASRAARDVAKRFGIARDEAYAIAISLSDGE